jgi:hypothetical protein
MKRTLTTFALYPDTINPIPLLHKSINASTSLSLSSHPSSSIYTYSDISCVSFLSCGMLQPLSLRNISAAVEMPYSPPRRLNENEESWLAAFVWINGPIAAIPTYRAIGLWEDFNKRFGTCYSIEEFFVLAAEITVDLEFNGGDRVDIT